jgi:outer membrane protein TolC
MTKSKKSFLFIQILMLLMIAIPLKAQTKKLTLDDAITTALRNNSDIKIAKLDVEKARAAVKEAFGYALPSVDLSANLSHFISKPKMAFPDFEAMLNNATYGVLFNEGVIPYNPSKFLPMGTKLQSFALSNSFQSKIQITQILFNSSVFRGIGATEIYLNLAKEKLKATISKTTVDTKKAFYGVLLSKKMLEITEEKYKNANEHLGIIKSMYAQGLVSDFDKMNAEVQIANIRPAIRQLKNIVENAKNGLKILLKMPQESEIEVVGDLELTDENLSSEEDLISQAEENNLTLKTLKIKRELDDEFTAVDRGGYWPTLAAFGNYSYSGTSDEWNFSTYTSSMVGVQFSINLFQGTRTFHKLQQDEISGQQTDEQIRLLKSATVMNVKAKLNELKRVKMEIDAMKQNISLAEKAYKIAEDKYKEGSATELEVKDAVISLSNAKTNYVKSVHDYLVSKAELDDLIGNVNPGYFESVKDYLTD